jgi:hypothetical protein
LIDRIKTTSEATIYTLSPQEERGYESSVKLLTQELTIIVETCRSVGLPSGTEGEAGIKSNESSGWTSQFSSLLSAATGQRPAGSRKAPKTLSEKPE